MQVKYMIAKLIKYLHLPAIRNSTIHDSSKIASRSHVVDVILKKYSYVGNNCTVVSADIGSFCSIADNVVIGGASHPTTWLSSSPVFCNGKNILKKNFSMHTFQSTKKTVIKNDVWIGSNCLIKGGITIDSGAIIGMGSVVTKSIGPYEIWAGNPAKILRKRFDDDIIHRLLKINWWDWEDVDIENNVEYMNDIEKFIKFNTKKQE